MRTLKTSLIAALIVPVLSVSAFAMQDQDTKKDEMAAKQAAHMAMIKEKCAKSEDMEACMAKAKEEMKMQEMAKKEEMKKKAEKPKKDHE